MADTRGTWDPAGERSQAQLVGCLGVWATEHGVLQLGVRCRCQWGRGHHLPHPTGVMSLKSDDVCVPHTIWVVGSILHPQSQLPCLRNLPPCLLNPHFNYSKIMLNPCINIAVASSAEFHYSKLGCRQSPWLKSKRRTDTCKKDRYCFQNKKAKLSFVRSPRCQRETDCR